MLGERIKTLRASKHLSQQQLAEALSVSKSTVAMWETNKRKPDHAILLQMAQLFAVSTDFLLGNVERSNAAGIADAEAAELYEKYRTLDEYGRAAVNGVMDAESKRCNAHAAKPHCPTIQLKLCNMSVSAGSGDYLDDDGYEYYTAPKNELTTQADYAVRVNGDSMEPTFFDGDILLVRGAPYINVGDIGVFIVNGEGYVKEFGGKTLISHNPKRADISLTAHDVVICSGLVLGKL